MGARDPRFQPRTLGEAALVGLAVLAQPGRACTLLLVVSAALTMTTAIAAEYPVRAIRYIVPSAAGGSADASARILAGVLTRQMGQQFIVDNRPGMSGIMGTDMVAKAAPDGYTIGHGNVLNLAISRSFPAKLPYDPDQDLQLVVQNLLSHNLLAVTLSVPVKSVQELIDYARKNPGKLLNASSGNGSSSHLGGELFKLMTATQIVHVPYKGAQQAVTEMIGGQVHLIFDNLGSITPHVKAGRVRGLGVTGLKRSLALPELPTISEAGVSGYEFTVWAGVIVPAGVPKAVIARLNAVVNRALASPRLREKFAALSYEPVGGTPQQFTEFARKETAKWADVVARSGAKID